MKGPPKDDMSTIETVTEVTVDLPREEQLGEHFLCEVNPKGQVPVLGSSSFSKPLADSVDITMYICERYPRLVPPEHKREIEELLRELHQINYVSLTYAGKLPLVQAMQTEIQQWLDDPSKGLSDRYRAALEYKMQVVRREKVSGLQDGETERNAQISKVLLERLASLIESENGPWLWGLEHPTALDAHLVTFIARLTDMKRGELVPERLRAYAKQAMEGDAWKAVMGNHKSTVPPQAR